MDKVIQCLTFLIGLQHSYFLILEMFLWNTPRGQKIFSMTLEYSQTTSVLAANQGLYNGFLAAGLFWSLMTSSLETAEQFRVFFLICVLAAGTYGGYSVGKKIFFIQGLPALLTLILIFGPR